MNLSIPMPTNFTPPSMPEILLQCAKIGLPEREGEKMYYFYDSKSWMVGKNKMKQWKSSLALWKLNFQERGGHLAKTNNWPTRKEVEEYAHQKGDQKGFWVSWYQYWQQRDFKQNGYGIDWKIKFGESFAKQR